MPAAVQCRGMSHATLVHSNVYSGIFMNVCVYADI